MRATFDKDADAAYIYFKEISQGEVKITISLNDSVSVDIDENRKILGIKILNISEI